jgi:hypothetical protein
MVEFVPSKKHLFLDVAGALIFARPTICLDERPATARRYHSLASQTRRYDCEWADSLFSPFLADFHRSTGPFSGFFPGPISGNRLSTTLIG